MALLKELNFTLELCSSQRARLGEQTMTMLLIATLKPSTLSVGRVEHPQKQKKPTYVFHCQPLRETNVTYNLSNWAELVG